MASFTDFKKPITRHREDKHFAPMIASIILAQPMFRLDDRWIPQPAKCSDCIVARENFRADIPQGRVLMKHAEKRVLSIGIEAKSRQPKSFALRLRNVRPEHGTLRVMFTVGFQHCCATAGERILPVLEAALISHAQRKGRTIYAADCCCAPICTRCSTMATSPSRRTIAWRSASASARNSRTAATITAIAAINCSYSGRK